MPFNDKRKNGEEEEDASNRASSFASSIYKDDDKAELKKTNFKTSLTLVVDDSQTTNRKQKERPTRADYSLLLSGLYALVLILIGLLFPLSDALQDNWLETEYVTVFLVYIYVLSTVFLIYVQGHMWYNAYKAHHGGGGKAHGHLSSHSSSSNSVVKVNSSNNNALTVTPAHGTGDVDKARRNRAKHRSMTAMVRYSSSVNLGSKEAERDFGTSDYGQESFGEEVDEEFEMWIDMTKLGGIFSHEGSSFYLRLGALLECIVVFGIGHLIYVCLELENNTHIPASCGINIFWWTYIIRLIFIVVQTFFLFKNQSVHVTKMKILARFGFAHLIATNFCIWLRTLVNEISHEYHHLAEESHVDANYSTSPGAPAAHLLPIHSIVKRATADGCSYYRGILQSASIYLFPFVLEYSLIAMGMFAIIYYSIDEHSKDGVIKGLANFFKVQRMDLSGVEKVEGHDHGDEGDHGGHGPSVFQKSHSGIFAGIILLAACIVSIILFFFTMDTQQNIVAAELIYLTSDLVLHSLLLVASVAAIVQVNRLSYIAKPVSIDDMLLYLSMAGTLILEIAITIASGNRLSPGGTGIASPALKSNEVLRLCSSMVAAIQTIAQVIVAMSGMRRYPSKASHLSEMPGRNFVTFLVVGNVSVWIFRTLQAKELSLHDTQRGFYGDLAWLLLMNINLPLLLFYRFHSSICLADVWMVAYEPLHQKVQKPPQEHGTQSYSTHAGDFPSNSIIRSVSVPQLYRQASSGGKKVGNGVESNGRAVFELDGISRAGSASSLNMGHRF